MALPDVDGVEAVFCKMHLTACPMVIGCVYRSPSSHSEAKHSLYKYLHIHALACRLILVGDFNLPDIDWLTMNHQSSSSDIIIDTMLTFNLSQIVKEPTRVQGCSSNILDLVFISDHFPADEAIIELTDGISDHKIVLCLIPLHERSMNSNSVLSFLDFSNADDTSVLDHLSYEFSSFEQLADNPDVDIETLWQKFKEIVSYCVSHYIPSKTKKERQFNPWINRDIIHAKRKVKRLRKSFKQTSNPITGKNLAEAISSMKSQIKAAKNHYFSYALPNFLNDAPQKFWNYLNPKNKKYSTMSPEESRDRANLFNKYFHSVFTTDNDIPPPLEIHGVNPIEPLRINEAGIFDLLLKTKIKKQPGPDNIPNEFLTRYTEWVTKYLFIIFNMSLTKSSLPNDWKIAQVIPIHKSGSEADVANYRPISLTSTICKIFEHIILKHITTYLENENILTPSQHGFRKGLSTVTQLTELIHELSSAIDHQKQIDLISLDFSKAFDRVSHQKLMEKLQVTIGKGPITNWIRAYLTKRTQFVKIDQQTSELTEVTSGVPQGGVLAPILFLIFINDLPQSIGTNIKLFADDCIIYKEINSPSDHMVLSNALLSVSDWCTKWQMTLNVKKSALLRITRRQNISNFAYTIGGTQLTSLKQHKYLGLVISSDLRWEAHVNYVTSSALKRLFFLKRRLQSAPPQTKLLAYKTFIRPTIEYANLVWFPATNNLIKKLESVQRKAVRFIYNKYSLLDSPTELIAKAGLLTLRNRAQLSRLKMLFQLIHKQLNIDSSRFISILETRQSRHKHPLTLQKYRFNSNCFRYSFFPQSIREWNRLPGCIINSKDLNTFLMLLNNHIRATHS